MLLIFFLFSALTLDVCTIPIITDEPVDVQADF